MLDNLLLIKDLYRDKNLYSGKTVVVAGWLRSIRLKRSFGFINLNDGGYLKGVQIVFDEEKIDNFSEIRKLNVGASLMVTGEVILTPNSQQSLEIHAAHIKVFDHGKADYPLQKKHHTVEYLRSISHLRPRTNLLGATFRVRSIVSYAIHKFFRENGFYYINTPILTYSDCEGAGEMFTATTLDLANVPKINQTEVDYSKDFFHNHTSLTVSGQLEAEALALALGRVYTFGPTFRAENSNTTRHAAEFWMIEPEVAFADLDDIMDVANDMIISVIQYVLKECSEDLAFLDKFVEDGLVKRLKAVVQTGKFERMSYNEAIKLLEKHNDEFDYKISWGKALQTEHEKYLTEKVIKAPVFVRDYPKNVKSFYMRSNDDGNTVAATDLLMPGIGELIGGSQREERADLLIERMNELGIDKKNYDWYIDLRRYGSVVHSGFGVGLERFIMYLTGVQNIRDVIPFPRTAGYNN